MRELFARWAVDNPVYLKVRATEGNRATEPLNPTHGKASEAPASDARPILVWAIEGNRKSVAQVAQRSTNRATAPFQPKAEAEQAFQRLVAPIAPVAHAVGQTPSMVEPSGDDAEAWQAWIAATEARWEARGWSQEEAQRIAWGFAENAWWDRHGTRPGPRCCAGCGESIEPEAGRRLAEGVYVHDRGNDDALECQLAFGRHWRGSARSALVNIGLAAPAPRDDE